MFAMAGAKESHNLLVTNLVRELSQQFRSRPCRVYSNDMRVRWQQAASTLIPT